MVEPKWLPQIHGVEYPNLWLALPDNRIDMKSDVSKEWENPYPEDEVKTSEEWQKLHPEITVLDPDGWDRQNYQYSWHEEKITYREYMKRRLFSTCVYNRVHDES